jgi:hypothetical protein
MPGCGGALGAAAEALAALVETVLGAVLRVDEVREVGWEAEA